MKINKGRIIIFIMLLLTGLLWWFSTPKESLLLLDQISHTIAGLSLTGLSIVFVLSYRNKTLESWFGGLDNIYKDHKWIAIISVILVFVHGRMSESVEESLAVGEVIKSTSALLGTLGQFAFIILVLVALFAKKLKYERWRFFHRIMVIPYLFGVYHTYASSKYELFTLSPLAIFTFITTALGIVAGTYTIFVYQKSGFKYKGLVSNVITLTKSTLELEIELDQTIEFDSGQYVFIKIFQKGIDKAPHPYTIARGKGKKIYLGIKNLGDGTKELYDHIETGTKVSIDGPYGNFKFTEEKSKQLWIAGGVGITAFLSFLEQGIGDAEIKLIYSYRGDKESAYSDLLKSYADKYSNFSLYLNDTSVNDRFVVEESHLQENTCVYICGPDKMIKDYSKNIKKLNKLTEVIFEEFGFAR